MGVEEAGPGAVLFSTSQPPRASSAAATATPTHRLIVLGMAYAATTPGGVRSSFRIHGQSLPLTRRTFAGLARCRPRSRLSRPLNKSVKLRKGFSRSLKVALDE